VYVKAFSGATVEVDGVSGGLAVAALRARVATAVGGTPDLVKLFYKGAAVEDDQEATSGSRKGAPPLPNTVNRRQTASLNRLYNLQRKN
jgi:hypothetical protein